MSEFARWVDHFTDNAAVHARVDAAIPFDADCRLPPDMRGPLVASIQRFQIGESGDGDQLLAKAARAGDADYLSAAQLFVAEEQQHAGLLLRLLAYLDAEPITAHWSDAVFVRLRRVLGLRTELMVLGVAEVVALSYYGGLADRHPDPVVRAVAGRIVADEHHHVAFQRHRLSAGFRHTPPAGRAFAAALWLVVAAGTAVVVAADHAPLLRSIGYRPRRFVSDVLAGFAALERSTLFDPGSVLASAI